MTPEIVNLVYSLTSLQLSENFFKDFPIQILRLTNLSHLDLNKNSLDALPKGLGKLTKLVELNLGTNYLETLPSEIENLSHSLRELSLNINSLKKIPSEIGRLSQLTALDLSENNLVYLPLEFKNLILLEDFYVYHNPNLVFPPKEIMEKANAFLDKQWDEWVELGERPCDAKGILKYLESEEAEKLFLDLFPEEAIKVFFFPVTFYQ